MFAGGQDVVSNIHRRWSFATMGPSSPKESYAISFACSAIVIVISHVVHLRTSAEWLWLYLPLGLVAMTGAHFLDYFALRGTPVNKLSKVAHVSAFANILWAITVLLGIAADFVFSKPAGSANYIIAGMLLAVGLRIGIFTSVFGAGTGRAIAVSFIQPLVFLFAFMPPFAYGTLAASYTGFSFGAALVVLGIVWTVIADRAGRPRVKSTFGLLQAFIAAWTENKVDKMEEFTESRAHDGVVETKIIRFLPGDARGSGTAIVLPDVHPGPFGKVGGSNLPYVLYKAFSNNALVMHSISDHSLNIPSNREVEKYVSSLGDSVIVEKGSTCSVPIQIKIGNSTATGIAFGNAAMLMLSLAPTGMEDIPQSVRDELESHGQNIGFSSVLVIDCHNAMGSHLSDSDRDDLAASASRCLVELRAHPQQEFKIGFAILDDVTHKLTEAKELGHAGLAVLVINTGSQNFAIGWADSNNMENSLRGHVISKVTSESITLLEVCTSDTHATSGKRTREGYFALGNTSSPDDVAAAYDELCRKAAERSAKSRFELASAESTIKVMGKQQFEDYSSALDRSMDVTKVFLAITVATYITMLFFS